MTDPVNHKKTKNDWLPPLQADEALIMGRPVCVVGENVQVSVRARLELAFALCVIIRRYFLWAAARKSVAC